MISKTLGIKTGLTAVIGSGGKTTLINKLSEELSENSKVIICTSTKIFRPIGILTLEEPTESEIIKAFKTANILCVGKPTDNNKLTLPSIDFEKLTLLSDYVFCEADGSKNLPLKAHNVNEPVIPKNAVEIIGVLGISCIGKKISDVCHRAEIFSEISGKNIEDTVDCEMISKVILKENLFDKLVINQVETDEQMEYAKIIANNIKISVYAGEIRKGDLICLR